MSGYNLQDKSAYIHFGRDYGFTYSCFVNNPENIPAIAELLLDRMFCMRGFPGADYNPIDEISGNIKKLNGGFSNTWHCSDPFWNSYKADAQFIVGYAALPTWYRGVVDELNSVNEHVRIDIIAERNITVYYDYHNKFMRYSPLEKTSLRTSPAVSAVLTFYTDETIPQTNKKFVSIIFHHIFRLLDYTWNFHNPSDYEYGRAEVKNKFIEKICEINNRAGDRYFAIDESTLTPEKLLNIFDPNICQMMSGLSSPGKQSSILKWAKTFSRFKGIKSVGEAIAKEKYLFYYNRGSFIEILQPSLISTDGFNIPVIPTYSGIAWKEYTTPITIQQIVKNKLYFMQKTQIFISDLYTLDGIKEELSKRPSIIQALENVIHELEKPEPVAVPVPEPVAKKPAVKKPIKKSTTRKSVTK